MKAPFPWFGGKARMARRIVALMPAHKQYIEPFFGAGSVFFAKEPCPHETINDLDHGVANLFTVLRDQPEEFMRLAELTIHSRELWRECREKWAQEEDPVRKAWRWWVVAQSFGGKWGRGWRYSQSGFPEWRRLRGRIECLPDVVARLQRAQIENEDGLHVLECYCTPDSLAYCDPPYQAATRRPGGVFQREMTDADHRALVAALLRLPGRFIISGYAHPAYLPLEESGWGRADFDVDAPSAGRVRHAGLQGTGSCAHQRRTESVWLDPVTAREKLASPQAALLECAE